MAKAKDQSAGGRQCFHCHLPGEMTSFMLFLRFFAVVVVVVAAAAAAVVISSIRGRVLWIVKYF